MPMQESHPVTVDEVTVTTADGPMRMIIARPAEPGPFIPIINFPHVGGLTDTMRTMATIVADGGYLCAVIDVYHRLGTIVLDPQSNNPDAVAIRRLAAASVTVDRAMADAQDAMDYLAARPDVDGTLFGTIGYGRGGALALRAASAFPGRVGAAASVLGFGFTEDGVEATRAWLGRIRAGVYCSFAELDDIIPASVPDELTRLLGDRLDTRLVIHSGARHPYVFPDRAVYDPAAATRDWEAIFSLWDRKLARPH